MEKIQFGSAPASYQAPSVHAGMGPYINGLLSEGMSNGPTDQYIGGSGSQTPHKQGSSWGKKLITAAAVVGGALLLKGPALGFLAKHGVTSLATAWTAVKGKLPLLLSTLPMVGGLFGKSGGKAAAGAAKAASGAKAAAGTQLNIPFG